MGGIACVYRGAGDVVCCPCIGLGVISACLGLEVVVLSGGCEEGIGAHNSNPLRRKLRGKAFEVAEVAVANGCGVNIAEYGRVFVIPDYAVVNG